MRLTIISDTHGEHEKLGELSGDVLIHCGDLFSLFSEDNRLDEVDEWFGRQRFDLILCIGGNHDFALQERIKPEPFENAVYLEDRSIVHDGVTFYGSPWVPDLAQHAFYQPSDQLAAKWSAIPEQTDVLITHTPPAGILDVSSHGLVLGCPYLAARSTELSHRTHCFGHVHASSGVLERDGVTYVNAALANHQYEMVRAPFELVI